MAHHEEWKCENCVFWHERGECRKREPQVSLSEIGMHQTVWPMVFPFEWCGEFRREDA